MYSVEIIDGVKCVVDGEKKYMVQTHERYGEYISVDNELNNDEEKPFNMLFTGRIKDAVDTIRNGKGDAIEVCSLFGTSISVLYFLDRNIGEKLREKTLEGCSDAIFAWIITCGNKDSMHGYTPLADGYQLKALYDEETKPLIFDTYTSAKEYITGIINRAKGYVKKYVEKAKCVENAEDKTNIRLEMYQRISKDLGTKSSVVWYFARDMVTDDMQVKNNYELQGYGYTIEQYLVNRR